MAAEGRLGLQSLTGCLTAVEDCLFITGRIALLGAGTTRRQLDRRPSSEIIAPRRGSFEVWMQAAIVYWVLASVNDAIPKVNKVIAKALLRALAAIFDMFLSAKEDSLSLEEFSQRFNQLLTESNMGIPPECLRETTALLHSSMITATKVIDTQASTLHISDAERGVSLLRIGSDERATLTAPLVLDNEIAQAPIEITVMFTRLNWKTGRGLILLQDPSGDPMRQEHCVVVDPHVREAKSEYSEAFSAQRWLRVLAEYVTPPEMQRAPYWRIIRTKRNAREDSLALFK